MRTTIIFLLIPVWLNGQTVFNSAGQNVRLSGLNTEIVYSVGEAIIETRPGTPYIFTQGYVQPEAAGFVEVIDLNTEASHLYTFPNPVCTVFNLCSDIPLSIDIQWQLYDMAGRTMMAGTMHKGNTTQQIDVKTLPPATYWLSYSDRGKKSAAAKGIIKMD